MMRSYIVWIIFVIPVMIFTGLWRLCEFFHFRVSGRLLHWFRKSDKKHQSEHFEREWYLRGDELEVLRADPGNQFAHRLAIELECMMLNPTASYNSAGNLIDEYRTAVHRWNEATGQPYVSGFGKD